MRIVVTNDDGIVAEGLWTLAGALREVAEVLVVAPDRERSAIGTAVTLLQPLRVSKMSPPVPGIEAYAVEGTPSDCVILAMSQLAGGGVDMVVSGINHGANLGDDVFISGTVAAAMQGYTRGCHALAVSMERPNNGYLSNGARLAVLLVEWVKSGVLAEKIFLNVNLPARSLAEIKGVLVTRLASGTHIDTAEVSGDGGRGYYQLVRQRLNNNAGRETDVGAAEGGHISLTPLHADMLNRLSPDIPADLGETLLRSLRDGKIAAGQ